jgi:hypothetical protein
LEFASHATWPSVKFGGVGQTWSMPLCSMRQTSAASSCHRIRTFGGGLTSAASSCPESREARSGVLALFEPPGSVGSWSLVRVAWSGTEAPTRLGDITLATLTASAALSPDGRWLAYIANTTGSAELWVRRYPSLDAAVRISPNGAAEPVWAKDGRELFYLEDDKLMRVRVGPDTKARFAYEAPVILVEKSFRRVGQPPSFDVAADGRLLMLGQVPAGPSVPIEVIVNWRDRVATRVSP